MFRLPIFATAFRLFFFACSAHALFVITLWILKLRGLSVAETSVSPTYWHTYEMVFGFSRAAIFGFLFTAGQHWSGKFLLGGSSLVMLFSLWLAGRFAFFLPLPWSYAAFALDIICTGFALYRLRPLMNPEQKHNHNVFYLTVMFFLSQVMALTALHAYSDGELFLHSLRVALLIVVLFVAVIAGRILPFFASVVMQGEKPRILPALERLVWPAALLALLSYALLPAGKFFTYLAAVAFAASAALHGLRWYFWRPFSSFRTPILAILYAGYLWLVAGFAMQAFAVLGLMPASPAWHMFGVGAGGVFIFGMMTRVALGHTGRPIKAPQLALAGYLTLNMALAVRVTLPLIGFADQAYLIAAILWIAAFLFYLVKYAPMLFAPRIDGKPG